MKSNLDKLFKTDKKIEQEGVWFDVSDDVGFLVKPWKPSNPAMKSAMATHYKPYAKQIEFGTIEDVKAREIMVKVFVNACLVDWRGVEIDGQVTPFSKETAIKFLTELPELYETLLSYAKDFHNYKEDYTPGREDVGNSSPAI